MFKCEYYDCPCCLASGECIATYPERCKYRNSEENKNQILIDLINYKNYIKGLDE